MSDNFYRAFEDRYRGSRALITARLRAYAPFLAALAGQQPQANAIDLGCGRGEWLELLAEAGLRGHGVDLDAGMLAACRERGLDVEQADALACLRARPDASVALVSAFHLVEHLPFEQLRALIGEAFRVLRPGGLLIMETPNPENLVVGASSFYMDPSHLHPLPPPLLAFVAEYGGFARHRVLRLQEAPRLRGEAPVGLIDVLEGVSPDYAVVGQKDAPAALLAPFEAAFATPHGIALAPLALRYDAQLARREAAQAERHGALAQQHAALAARLDGAEAELRGHVTQLEQRLHDTLASRSWRITAPLREAGVRARRLRERARRLGAPRALLRRALFALLRPVARALLRRRAAARLAQRLLRPLPGLRARLESLLRQANAAPPAAAPADDLSPRTARFHRELKDSLKAGKN